VVFILESPQYYDVAATNVGKVAGDIGFYAEICVVVFDLFLGIIFDTFGRRIPLVIGYMVCGACIILMPFGGSVYPGLLLLRIFISLGLIPSANTPLLPDYVMEES
jgi:MFS family permease